jgi:tetratricopeptide (TPR) repeat protein
MLTIAATSTRWRREPVVNRARHRKSFKYGWAIAGLGLSLTMASQTALWAQKQQSLVGRRVVAKYPGFKLTLEHKVVRHDEWAVYRVKEAAGQRLMLEIPGRGLRGWALAKDVIPVENAIKFYTAYIRSNPEDPYGYVFRGTFGWREANDLELALRDFGEAIRLMRSRSAPPAVLSWGLSNRGCILIQKKEFEKSLLDFDEAIRVAPNDVQPYIDRGSAHREMKDYERAIDDFNRAIQLHPSEAPAYYWRGTAWAAQSKHLRAIADYDEAVRRDPYYVSAYHQRALSWNAVREYEKAIADYNKCVRLDQEFAPAYRGRAWTWATCPVAKFRDSQQAVESATKACELSNWKDVSSITVLAAAYAEARDFASAVKWQEQAVGLTVNEHEKENLRRRLELYKNQKPYREPSV